MAISKLIFDGEVQMDVTQDTVTPNSLLSGYTATSASGDKIEGNIETKTIADIRTSGQNVIVPPGYYDRSYSASVASGTAGTPTATKSSVVNHNVIVTPRVTNTTGYIQGGTINGNPVTVSASELVSGSQTITSNQTVDVKNLAQVVVNVQPNNQNVTVNPSLSQQIITADEGYTGLGTVTVTAMPTGTVNVSASKGTVSNNTVHITPRVTKSQGYITSGTTAGNAVTVTASELVSGSQTVPYNGTYDVTNLAELVVDVEGGNPPINNQSKTVDPDITQQTVTYDSGYTGLENVVVRAMPTGTEGTPEAEVTTDQQTQNIIVTPKVTNSQGYISGGLRVGEPVTINPGVTSFNGDTGDITYTAPVTSVNGSTGDVNLTIPTNTNQLTNGAGFLTSSTGVTSVNGSHGDVTVTVPTKTSQITNDSGFLTSSTGVTSVNGSTGAVTVTSPAIYVTEEGTSGDWKYRKWSNKTCECWAKIKVLNNEKVSSSWGSGDNNTMVYKDIPRQSYPVTFKSNTVIYETVTASEGTKTLFVSNGGDMAPTTTQTGGYVVWRPTNAGVNITLYLNYYVRGELP